MVKFTRDYDCLCVLRETTNHLKASFVCCCLNYMTSRAILPSVIGHQVQEIAREFDDQSRSPNLTDSYSVTNVVKIRTASQTTKNHRIVDIF